MKKSLLFTVAVTMLLTGFLGEAQQEPAFPEAGGDKFELWYLILIGAVYSVVEFILGKTTLVKSNSIIEVIGNGFVTVVRAIWPSKFD